MHFVPLVLIALLWLAAPMANSGGTNEQNSAAPAASERIIDLSRVIEPTAPDAERKFVVHTRDALQEIHGKVRPEGEWYIMSDVEMMDHVGTHIEMPFHCLKQGKDLSQVPVDQLAGDAVILDLKNAEAEGGVTLEQVQAAAKKAGGVRKGDIVFCKMGKTDYFATSPLQWLVGQGIKLMGVDSAGVELANDATHANTNHLVLFRAGIPVIENLANLDRLTRSRVRVYALPIAVHGLDAFPLRVVAVERAR
jgi:arylformamidase